MVGNWVLSAILRFSTNGEAVMKKLSENSRKLAEDQKKIENQVKAIGIAEERMATKAKAAQAMVLNAQKAGSIEQQKMAHRTQVANNALGQSVDRIALAHSRLAITSRVAGNEATSFQKKLNLEKERVKIATDAATAAYERSMGIIDKDTAATLRYERAQSSIAIRKQSMADRAMEQAKKEGIQREKLDLQAKAIEQNRVIAIRRFEGAQQRLNIQEQTMARNRETAALRYANSIKRQELATKALELREQKLKDTEARLFAKRAQQHQKITDDAKYQNLSNAVYAGQMATQALGGALLGGLTGAASMEKAMATVYLATPSHNAANTMRDRHAMESMAYSMSGMTAQDVTTIANEMAAAAQKGLNDPQRLMEVFPTIAKAADIEFIRSQKDPVTTIKEMVPLVHLFGAYHGKQLEHMLDEANRMRLVTGNTFSDLVTQGRMYIPSAVGAGVGTDEIMLLTSIMGQTGFLKSRGGTALNNIITNALGAETLTSHMSKAKRRGMKDLEMFDAHGRLKFIDKDGNLLLTKMLFYLGDMLDRFKRQDAYSARGRFTQDVNNVFGKEGARFVQEMSMKSTREQYERNREAMAHMGTIEQQFEFYKGTLFFAWNNFNTNLRNTGIILMKGRLPEATKMLTAWGNSISDLNHQLLAHPRMREGISKMLTYGVMPILAIGTALGWLNLIFIKPFVMLMKDVAGGFSNVWKVVVKLWTWIRKPDVWENLLRVFIKMKPAMTVVGDLLGKIALGFVKFVPILNVIADILGATKSTSAEEQAPLSKDQYDYWRKYAGKHGWRSVPQSVRMHFAEGRKEQGIINMEHVNISLPGVTDAPGFVEGLKGLNILGTGTSSQTPPHLMHRITAHSH